VNRKAKTLLNNVRKQHSGIKDRKITELIWQLLTCFSARRPNHLQHNCLNYGGLDPFGSRKAYIYTIRSLLLTSRSIRGKLGIAASVSEKTSP
jgi:hypothetical protein